MAQALYAFSATKAAADRIVDARLLEQHRLIEKLQRQGAQATGRLAEAQQQYVAELERRDRAYAQAVAIFRKAVQDIVATPEGEAALRRFNAGDESGALAVRQRVTLAVIAGDGAVLGVQQVRVGDVPFSAIVGDLLAARPRAVWLQSGIRHDDFARALADAGILVVQDRCLMVEHRRLR